MCAAREDQMTGHDFPVLTRRAAVRFGAAGLLALPLVGAAAGNSSAHGTPVASPEASGDIALWQDQMNAYDDSGDFSAIQENADGVTASVLVELPAIEFSGAGRSPSLPVGPSQFIYRFRNSVVVAPDSDHQPFRFVEIDWNTEGVPRGPNGSFVSPHFDFHFYTMPLEEMERDVTCVSSNGKTCDALLTDYEQMRRLQNMPEARYIPDLYRADVGSAIPTMGLHLLDMTAEYSVDAVDHYPVLIYGTFDGRVIFAEASVTLSTLQDAKAAPEQRLTFPFRQPAAFAKETDWPTEFVIAYIPKTAGFRAGFTQFERQLAS